MRRKIVLSGFKTEKQAREFADKYNNGATQFNIKSDVEVKGKTVILSFDSSNQKLIDAHKPKCEEKEGTCELCG